MYCYERFTAGHIVKTAAALSAVVFLFCLAGCRSCADTPAGKELYRSANQEKSRRKPVRKRASDYSRIPGNYPASWQTSTIGN